MKSTELKRNTEAFETRTFRRKSFISVCALTDETFDTQDTWALRSDFSSIMIFFIIFS